MRIPLFGRRGFHISASAMALFLALIGAGCPAVNDGLASSEKGVECEIAITRDDDGHWRVRLENDIFYAVYSTVGNKSQKESCLTGFVLKETGINSASCDLKYASGIDGGAWKGLLSNATLTRDLPESKAVQLEFEGIEADGRKRPDWKVEVMIFSDRPYLQVRYTDYYVNVVDQGCPGGTNNGEVCFWGEEEWMRQKLWDSVPLYVHGEDNVPFFNRTDSYGDMREDDAGALNYNGYFIMGAFNPENGLGYGRIAPVDTIDVINVLSAATGPRGFELFPNWRRPHRPYTQYLFPSRSGAEGILETGQAIVDGIGPIIDIWYGEAQKFGYAGVPQEWVNIVGNVSDPASEIVSLTYSINGEPGRESGGVAGGLNMGPYPPREHMEGLIGPQGPRRLYQKGDFNADIHLDRFRPGKNDIVVTALNARGQKKSETIRLDFGSGESAKLPFSIEWKTVGSILDVAHIVDGLWRLSDDGIRTLEIGYDRAIAIGDISWRDYEVTVTATIHGIDPAERAPASGRGVGGALGVMLRWQGHVPFRNIDQPYIGWSRVGGGVWGVIDEGRSARFSLRAEPSADPNSLFDSLSPEVGETYGIKVRVRSLGEGSLYQSKIWKADEKEPDSWSLEVRADSGNLSQGSLLLIAHHMDVTFGDITVTPVVE